MGKQKIIPFVIIAGVIILLCVLVLSYNHAVEFFVRSGVTGKLAHTGVIGFELAFIVGVVIVTWTRWIGEPVKNSYKVVFGLGVFINTYSNISSGIVQDGKAIVFYRFNSQLAIDEAILIDLLIPALFISFEIVVGDALSQARFIRKRLLKEDTKEIREVENKTSSTNKTKTKSKKENIVQQIKKMKKEAQKEKLTEDKPEKSKKKKVNLDDVIQVATSFEKDNNRRPTIEELKEVAGVTFHYANKALTTMKKENLVNE